MKWLQFSRSVMSDSLRPHRLQHATLPCLSLSPRVCSSSCLSSQWFHPTILSSVTPFSSCPQSFPQITSGSFPVSQFFASGGQSIGASASASVLPMNIQDWFPLWLAGLISLQSKGLSRVFSSTTVQKHQFCGTLIWVKWLRCDLSDVILIGSRVSNYHRLPLWKNQCRTYMFKGVHKFSFKLIMF